MLLERGRRTKAWLLTKALIAATKRRTKIATALLRNNIYHKSEYVYVADEKLNFVAAPLDPQIHDTSFHEFKDGKGNSVGEILQKAVDKANGQLARYKWTKKLDDGSIEDKLSIAKLSPRWKWVVGTFI